VLLLYLFIVFWYLFDKGNSLYLGKRRRTYVLKQEFKELIDQYGSEIFSFCCYLCHSRVLGEDLYQDVMLKTMEKCRNINVLKNPRSYILGIAVRLYKNNKRKLENRRRLAGECPMEEAEQMIFDEEDSLPENKYLKKELKTALWREIENLSDKDRMVLKMYYGMECSIKEISNACKLPTGTVKTRLFQVRKKLKRELEKQGFGLSS